jgi:hypothetical protein
MMGVMEDRERQTTIADTSRGTCDGMLIGIRCRLREERRGVLEFDFVVPHFVRWPFFFITLSKSTF